MSHRLGMAAAVAIALAAHAASSYAADQALDYEYFKTRVEPVFLQKRPDHVRCYVCHSESNSAFKLEKLSPGSTFWTEEQSRKNFEVVSRLVIPGQPAQSPLVVKALATAEGGSPTHAGGKFWKTKDDPEYKAFVEFVNSRRR